MRPESRSLTLARVLARAPRLAIIGAGLLLAAAGLRGALAPPAPITSTARVTTAAPVSVAPFAEAFVRELLTWDGRDPAERERRLRAYLAEGLDPDAGITPVPGTAQRPEWTVATGARAAEHAGGWRVAVLAGLPSGRRITLLVTVTAGAAGDLVVSDYPSLTALAARSTARPQEWNDFVEDAGLERVVERALRNYLAGNAGDLQADLAPGAHVTTPETTAQLTAIDELAWQQPGRRVAALATAELADGTRLRLRFHLSLTRDGRWFVAAINPTHHTTQGAAP
ncbi:conjugal transfer protein [Conexibacter sp. W3-3-2]|uniref:conjugal transfer protein n=1 Tax=Conexibacter sp. W3-3-2 TaxID=2675227 RepID=UPI0018AC56F2|nr:conjugal transfer protein [Conexibacter sp. W3-3-2]